MMNTRPLLSALIPFLGVVSIAALAPAADAAEDYGPDTCRDGYVWREATPDDRVCVTPNSRAKAAADNAAADSRRASLSLWITQWFDTSGSVCDGDICQVTSAATIPRIQVNGDHFNLGDVYVALYRTSDGSVLWSIEGTAQAQSGYSGGAFGVRSSQIDCGMGRDNAYVQAYDYTSERWSERVYVDVECAA